jgi:hypothetical protein
MLFSLPGKHVKMVEPRIAELKTNRTKVKWNNNCKTQFIEQFVCEEKYDFVKNVAENDQCDMVTNRLELLFQNNAKNVFVRKTLNSYKPAARKDDHVWYSRRCRQKRDDYHKAKKGL